MCANLRRPGRSLPTVVICSLAAAVIGCSTNRVEHPCPGVTSPCFFQPAAPAAPGKAWHLAFSEEFNGGDFDHNKLTPCFDWNYGDCTSSFNLGREVYEPEQVSVRDGSAVLTAAPLSPPEPNAACYQSLCTYKSGMLSTARVNAETDRYLFAFTYGYVDTRIKFPAVPGFFTAIWMLPTNSAYDYRSEIDLVEILGKDPTTVYMTYAYDNRAASYRVNKGPGHNGECPVRDFSQDWVRFGVDWEPDHIAWYINGVKCGEFHETAKIESGSMQLIMNLAVDNSWERDAHAVLEDQGLVGQLSVDYIRVYQQH